MYSTTPSDWAREDLYFDCLIDSILYLHLESFTKIQDGRLLLLGARDAESDIDSKFATVF